MKGQGLLQYRLPGQRFGRRRPAALLGWLVTLLAAFALLAGPAAAQVRGGIVLASFKGEVTTALAGYIDRAISTAEDNGDAAVILQLDTPGGSSDAMLQITQRITNAHVPVIVYIAPQGAHASSAGTFITLAGHIAAMAPGSTIGAASPVTGEGQDLPSTLKAKVTNTFVSDIHNLAARRGDKAVAWAEMAVSDAAAATADEALSLGVIDVIAPDVPSLLRQLDGRQVTVNGQAVTLKLSDLPIQPIPLSPIEQFLNTIANPQIAAILLSLGTTGLILELYNPGAYLPGVAGAICLLLAFYALNVLEANWVGLGFMALAFVLFVLDIKAPTHGLLTTGGIISFLLGGFVLFNTPNLQVPWGTLIVLSLCLAAFFAFAISKALAAQHRQPVTGMEGLIGQTAEVRQPLEPSGMVLVEGELWKADVVDGAGAAGKAVPRGAQVVITGYEGFRLHVRPTVEAETDKLVELEPFTGSRA